MNLSNKRDSSLKMIDGDKNINLTSRELSYYSEHSCVTDPGSYVRLFENLPDGVCELAEIVQGLVVHYNDRDIFEVPKSRWHEIDLRYVEDMLARIMELDNRPLNQPRPFETRLVGCCRDFSVLLCAMARQKKIPTRTRAGFASYFKPNFNCDHVVVEYWDSSTQSWKIIDPELTPKHIEHYQINFKINDVPHDRFWYSGVVWQQCRAGQVDPENFGVTPESEFKGLWYVGHQLVHDFAGLNKEELLLWDRWGPMPPRGMPENRTPAEDLALLDEVASYCLPGNERVDEFRLLYEHSTLKVPTQVESHSPARFDELPRLVPLNFQKI